MERCSSRFLFDSYYFGRRGDLLISYLSRPMSPPPGSSLYEAPFLFLNTGIFLFVGTKGESIIFVNPIPDHEDPFLSLLFRRMIISMNMLPFGPIFMRIKILSSLLMIFLIFLFAATFFFLRKFDAQIPSLSRGGFKHNIVLVSSSPNLLSLA